MCETLENIFSNFWDVEKVENNASILIRIINYIIILHNTIIMCDYYFDRKIRKLNYM